MRVRISQRQYLWDKKSARFQGSLFSNGSVVQRVKVIGGPGKNALGRSFLRTAESIPTRLSHRFQGASFFNLVGDVMHQSLGTPGCVNPWSRPHAGSGNTWRAFSASSALMREPAPLHLCLFGTPLFQPAAGLRPSCLMNI